MGQLDDADNRPDDSADADCDLHGPRFAAYESAAREAVEAHPLEGENLDTPYLDDAQMWVAVYIELLQFKNKLLRDTYTALQTLPPPARDDVQHTDVVVLEAEAQRFRARLALWTDRREELARKAAPAEGWPAPAPQTTR